MSRLILTLKSKEEMDYSYFDKYHFLSSIYSIIDQKAFPEFHNSNDFRFFSFSDFFPGGNLTPEDVKKVIISSPDDEFIKLLYEKLSERNYLYLEDKVVDVTQISRFDVNEFVKDFTTGSPVVLYKDNKKNIYFSLRNGDNLSFFLERLKDNAIKKYRQFYNDENFEMDGFIFDTLKFRKEVRVQLKKRGQLFYFIGTMWYSMKKIRIKRDYIPFYRFIMDCGIGEKNALGFGFLNPRS